MVWSWVYESQHHVSGVSAGSCPPHNLSVGPSSSSSSSQGNDGAGSMGAPSPLGPVSSSHLHHHHHHHHLHHPGCGSDAGIHGGHSHPGSTPEPQTPSTLQFNVSMNLAFQHSNPFGDPDYYGKKKQTIIISF